MSKLYQIGIKNITFFHNLYYICYGLTKFITIELNLFAADQMNL